MLVVLAISSLVPVIVQAAEGTSEDSPPIALDKPLSEEALTVDHLQARLNALSQQSDWPEEQRNLLIDLYSQALGKVRSVQEWKSKVQEFEKAARQAPALLREIREELVEAPDALDYDFAANPSLAALEQKIIQTEADLAAARKRVAEAESAPKLRSERRIQLAKRIAEAKAMLQEITQELDAPPASNITPALHAAQQALLFARRQDRQAETLAYEKELAYYDASQELQTARLAQAARRVAQLDQWQDQLREQLNERRRVASQLAAQEAEQERQKAEGAVFAHPLRSQLAEENMELVNLRLGKEGLTAKIEQTSRHLSQIKQIQDQLQEEFNQVVKRVQTVEEAGLSINDSIGLLLRQQRAQLPDITEHQEEIQNRQPILSDTQIQLLNYQDEIKAEILDVESQVSAMMSSLEPTLSPWKRQYIERELRRLLQSKQGYLNDLVGDYLTYYNQLIELDAAQRRLVKFTRHYADFIDQRVLWMRSAGHLAPSDLIRELSALKSFVFHPDWNDLFMGLNRELRRHPGTITLGLLVFGLLLYARRRLSCPLTALGEQAGKGYNTSYRITLHALLCTALAALPWPFLMGFVGWRIGEQVRGAGLVAGLAEAFQMVALTYFILEFFVQACRPKGLGLAHFRWSPYTVNLIGRTLPWIKILGLPLLFLIASIEGEINRAAQGRVIFIIGMGFAAFFAHRLLHPTLGLWSAPVSRGETSQALRLRFVWYLIGLGMPLFLAITAGLGYYYAALQLTWRLQITLWLILGVLVLNAMILRWLYVARRGLAIEQARKRRAALAESRENTEHQTDSGSPTSLEMEEVDLGVVRNQTRKLLSSFAGLALLLGAWGIWVDVLPALSVLNKITLWQAETQSAPAPQPVLNPRNFGMTGGNQPSEPDAQSPSAVAGATASAGETDSAVDDRSTSLITLADLALALLIALMTFIASKNIPGLLEITLLRSLHLQPGGGYAVTTLIRYFITLVGLILAFGMIGIPWSKVQWLAAAITVGIGFGLQEIFANFVSGLIILFQRPIRLGDVITVGDVTGTVSQIQIRATTIKDWDNKSLLVPNKEFITGRVINWTLSDSVIRLVLPVSIAYGSDIQLAHHLLLKVAQDNPQVLVEPAPSVFFKGFGESRLNFDLRVYIPNIDYWVNVQNDLNLAIDRVFRSAEIKLALPQQDVHVRTFPENVQLEKLETTTGRLTA